jgi:hypothetical protein
MSFLSSQVALQLSQEALHFLLFSLRFMTCPGKGTNPEGHTLGHCYFPTSQFHAHASIAMHHKKGFGQ